MSYWDIGAMMIYYTRRANRNAGDIPIRRAADPVSNSVFGGAGSAAAESFAQDPADRAENVASGSSGGLGGADTGGVSDPGNIGDVINDNSNELGSTPGSNEYGSDENYENIAPFQPNPSQE